MTSELLPRSGWNPSEARGESESNGPRGARWVVAALYVIFALIIVSWYTGWGENSPQTAAPAAPQPQHHSMHPQG